MQYKYSLLEPSHHHRPTIHRDSHSLITSINKLEINELLAWADDGMLYIYTQKKNWAGVLNVDFKRYENVR